MEQTSEAGPSRIPLLENSASKDVQPRKRRRRRLLSVLEGVSGDEAMDEILSNSEESGSGAGDPASGHHTHTNRYEPSAAALMRRGSIDYHPPLSLTNTGHRTECRSRSEEHVGCCCGRDRPLAAIPLQVVPSSDPQDKFGGLNVPTSSGAGRLTRVPLSPKAADLHSARQHKQLAETQGQGGDADQPPAKTTVEILESRPRTQEDRPAPSQGRKQKQDSVQASQPTEQEPPNSSKRLGRKRQSDEESQKSPRFVVSSKRRICASSDKENTPSRSDSSHFSLEDAQRDSSHSPYENHDGSAGSKQEDEGCAAALLVLREVGSNSWRAQRSLVLRNETDLDCSLGPGRPMLSDESQQSSKRSGPSLDMLERRAGSGGIMLQSAQPTVAAPIEDGEDPSLLHDLHAINQEISRKGLWERGEPGVQIAELKPASGAGAATPTAPLTDWSGRSDNPTQEVLRPAASLTPPSAAMPTPSSWAYRHPADYNTHSSPCCPDSTKDQVAEAVNELGQLPPVVALRHDEMRTDANVTPVAIAPPIVFEPCGEPNSRREPQPETALGSSLTLSPGNEANETTDSAGTETALERQAMSADYLLLSGEEEASASLEPRRPGCAMGKAALNAAPRFSQDSIFDDARASAPPPQHRNPILADSNEDDCSRHERTLDGFARTVNEQFLEGLDDLDFANLELTPAPQSKTNTSLPRASASPTANPAFQRTRSRKGRADSFDDLAEDNGFWDEVFDGVMRPLDTMAVLEADEWPDLEALSDIEASATAAFGPPPMPCSPPPGAHLGFSTAANKTLAPPSEAAVARVLKRLAQPAGTKGMPEEDVENMDAVLAARREAQSVSLPARRPPQVSAVTDQEEGHTSLDQWNEDQICHEGAPADSQLIPATVSFKRANGLSLELNAAALEAAKRKMARWEAEHCQEKGNTPELAVGVNLEHRRTINANVIRGPTKPSDGRVASVVPGIEPTLTKVSPSTHRCRETAGGTPGQGEPIKSGVTLPKGPDNEAASVDASPDDLPLTPSEIVQADPQADSQVSTPVRHVAARFNGSLGTAGKEASTPDRPTFTRLDGRSSRISLGMTPRANFTPKTAGRPTFKTPFKHGVAAARPSIMLGSGSPRAVAQSRNYPQDLRASSKQGAGGALNPTRSDPSVFELKAIVPRLSLKDYRMLPYVPRRVPAEEVPHEVMTIIKEPRMSFCWVFDSPTGEDCGVKTALEELIKAGASRVDVAWVKNHWTMILWKLAYYTRCKPQEAAIWWCFEQVMRQLRYRYEREINLAQRSAIKRIQERDSSPSLPMILRVFGHQRINAEDAGSPGEHAKFENSVSGGYDYELELTDGWYWMRARMDRTLSRAFKRGRIPLGMKLAIQGAKLESNSTDGNDVLAASGISRLVLSGNGTSPAPWDSRMGFQRHAFSASLRSLTADGGLIPSMEVTITRLFPIAYVESNGTSMQQMGSARGAAEEADAQRAWEARREDSRSRLEGKIEHDLKHIDEVQELLSASVGQDSGSTDQSEEEGGDGAQSDSAFALDYDLLADNALDDLLSSDTPSSTLASRLRSVPTAGQPRFLYRLSYLASARSDHMRRAARANLELELNGLCPVRKVRSFRVCRFIDAREAKRKRPSKRTVQLTVWDLGDLDQGTLEEGATYKVTNLIPTQRSSWRSCNVEADAFLATRRDSTWKRLR